MLSANWAPASGPLLPRVPTGEKAWAWGGRFPSDETTRPAPLREGTRRRRSAHSQPAPLPSLIAAALCFSGHLLSEESPGGRRFLPRAGCSWRFFLAAARGRAARWRVGGRREAAPSLSHGRYPHPRFCANETNSPGSPWETQRILLNSV